MFKFFFQKTKSASMPDHHIKGEPAASMYVREKGCLTFYTNRETPCIWLFLLPNIRIRPKLENSVLMGPCQAACVIRDLTPLPRESLCTILVCSVKVKLAFSVASAQSLRPQRGQRVEGATDPLAKLFRRCAEFGNRSLIKDAPD